MYRFDVVVSDGKLETAREVKIEVEEVNAAPVALAAVVDATEDEQVKIQLKGTDIESSTLTYKVVDLPQNGQLVGSGAELSYVPGKDFNGQDGFTFVVSDGELESASAKVGITVKPVGDAPQMTVVENLTGAREDEVYALSHGALLEVSDAYDADGDELTFLITKVSSGTLFDAEGEVHWSNGSLARESQWTGCRRLMSTGKWRHSRYKWQTSLDSTSSVLWR